MSIDPVLETLKSETRALHEQTESRVNLPLRLQNRQRYQQLLTAFYGFYAPVEAMLVGCKPLAAVGIDVGLRRKVPLLIEDLRFFNIQVEALPLATDIPRIDTASEGFGCLYVLEGATLGSQIIKRLLFQQLNISAKNGGAFFNVYGENVSSMWGHFRHWLSLYSSEHPQERPRIVGAAQQTFLKLDNWFSRTLTPE